MKRKTQAKEEITKSSGKRDRRIESERAHARTCG